MDVAVWLRDLGLQQYDALFPRNDIDAEVPSDLTDADLEKIGVSFGHRKRLRKAVAALANRRPRLPVATPISPVAPTPPSVGSSPSCSQDLVGSTARSRPGSILRTCARSFALPGCLFGRGRAPSDGFVVKSAGDGVLAYFGFPRAREEDAERVVRPASTSASWLVAKLETRANEKLEVRTLALRPASSSLAI